MIGYVLRGFEGKNGCMLLVTDLSTVFIFLFMSVCGLDGTLRF
jgi:hypothetical protein